jgi:preprotein translocase subunit SecD
MKITLRIWILIIVLLFAFISIVNLNAFQPGVLVKSVDKNSTAFNEGLRTGMIITEINSEAIKNLNDYSNVVHNLFLNLSNSSEKIRLDIKTDQGEFIFYTKNTPEISVVDIPKTKIKTGMDLQGGSRALVKPEKSLTANEMSDLIAVTSNRLNVFGISDVTVRPVTDLSGNSFMLVEVAGASAADIRELVSKQGKFEAKIGNDTVFVGGKKDITDVCRTDASCSRIEACYPDQNGGEYCRFSFVVYLSEAAAQRHADITSKLGINMTESGRYLDKKLDLYLDDNLVDSLFISEDLKGQVTTQIQVQGSGSGKTHDEALNDAKDNMHKLQTLLITGSLPYKLEIVKLDTISPALGKEFAMNIAYLAIVVFIIISAILFVKYRKIKITLSVILTMFSEAFITLGIAALIRWNLDAPSIAGIIAGMGTGVNDQIVIVDESVSNVQLGLKERIKRAFFIIIGAFFTIIAAMLPLFWAGAGMLRGFALTTIIGVSVGIIITRPAFADIIKQIQE